MDESGAPAEGRTGGTGWRTARAFGRLARGFWSGATARRAWFLTGSLAGNVLLGITADLTIASWNRWFLDALEAHRVGGLRQAAALFPAIVAGAAAIHVGVILSRDHPGALAGVTRGCARRPLARPRPLLPAHAR